MTRLADDGTLVICDKKKAMKRIITFILEFRELLDGVKQLRG